MARLQGHVGEGGWVASGFFQETAAMDDGAKWGERMDSLFCCLLHITVMPPGTPLSQLVARCLSAHGLL